MTEDERREHVEWLRRQASAARGAARFYEWWLARVEGRSVG